VEGYKAAERYAALEPTREPFLKRARDSAALTVPYLMPPAGFGPHTELPTPYQSIGARGIRTLSSKLLLALFPANTPFFKYSIDDLTLRKLEAENGQAGMRGEVEKALSAREKAVLQEMETALFRPAAFTALQHLLAAGNFLMYVPDKGATRGYRLDQYVVRRDPAGNLLEFITKEAVLPGSLPPQTRAVIEASVGTNAPPSGKTVTASVSDQKPTAVDAATWDLYTLVCRNYANNRWEIFQEINGIKVPDSEGHYPLDKLPWLVLRLSSQPGESYGRSYVEEYLGDLDSLEGLTQSIVESAAAAARVVFLVKPNGTTSLRVVAKARNGDTVPGDTNDVGALQLNKGGDLQVAAKKAEDIAQNLAFAFLLNTAIQRNGERVTAEEIRYMAAELDTALGGVYTLLGAEFQLIAVRRFEQRMEAAKAVAPLPKDMVSPQIVTGIEAIGRGADQRNLKLFVAEIIQTLGPEMALKVVNLHEFIKRSAAAYGIDTEGLIASQEEMEQSEQQAMLMQMVQQLGPEGLKQLGGMAQQQMKLSAAEQPTQ
jgi:hypothetical protein